MAFSDLTPEQQNAVNDALRKLLTTIGGLKALPLDFSIAGDSLPEGESFLVRATAMETELFVSSDSGDDDNDGLTEETAVQTLDMAHMLAPRPGSGSKVILNLAGAGGFGADATGPLDYPIRSVLLPDSSNSELQNFCYRGPNMVLVDDLTTGPTSETITAVTSLWWQVGGSGRTRTASDAKPATGGGITDWTRAGTRISKDSGTTAWTVNDSAMRFLRVVRAGRKVIFEVPISRNGAHTIDVDIHELPDGTSLASVLQVGDTIEIVMCGARLTNPLDLSIGIEGHGGCSGPFDEDQTPSTRGGGGAWMERIEFDRRLMAFGCFGLSFDRCHFSTAGDENYFGGSGNFVNCLHTSLGVLFHGGFSWIHDTANCRPDVAANDGTADPIYQDVDAWSLNHVVRGGATYTAGSGTSGSPAYLSIERGLSIYDCVLRPAIQAQYHGILRVLLSNARKVHIQGENNLAGVTVKTGSMVRYEPNFAHLVGNAAGSSGFDDCSIGGAYKTWDEVQGGGTLPAPSAANNFIDNTYNFSRLTGYDS